MIGINRRKMIAAMLGCPLATLPGCSPRQVPRDGELRHTNFGIGHRIRDGLDVPVDLGILTHVPVVIIGGGVAGLSAAWRLNLAGFEEFVVIELEDAPGGTARSGQRGQLSYPWGAHYIPAPMKDNVPLIRLFQEMGVVEDIDEEGAPVIGEQFLCRDPQERLFVNGKWREGIYPFEDASEEDLRQLAEFRLEVDRWVEARDASGRRMFAVPMAYGSDEESVRALDRVSMAQWMIDHGWTSPRLNWLVDYGCRDDYGLSTENVSAWAGVFYFASRIPAPGHESQSVITWPEGNGRVINHFVDRVGERVRCGLAASAISPVNRGDDRFEGPLSVVAMDTRTGDYVGWQADQVIFATPQMLASHLIRQSDRQMRRNSSDFQYGSWLVANLHLRDRPIEAGFPLCWDNVIQDSKSLGYVTATHQLGVDHGPTVLTWYHPFADADAAETRKQMLGLQWSDWAAFVMNDLSMAHPDLVDLVTRVDVMLWGHAMIQPRVGFVWSPSRAAASRPLGAIHFAGTDLSGIALFEEAFYHGIRAAEEVLAQRHFEHNRMLPSPVGPAS